VEQNKNGDREVAAFAAEPPIETLRLALQRERGSFSNFHGGTPIRPLFRGWVRGGRKLKGLDRLLKELRKKEKGLYAPLLPFPARTRLLGESISRMQPRT
jgi:hypothetical protein